MLWISERLSNKDHALRCCKCVWNIMIITCLNSTSPVCASYAVRKVWFILNNLTAEDEVFCISSTSLAKNALRSIWPQQTTSGKQEIFNYARLARPLISCLRRLQQKLVKCWFYCFFAVVIIRPSKQRNKF